MWCFEQLIRYLYTYMWLKKIYLDYGDEAGMDKSWLNFSWERESMKAKFLLTAHRRKNRNSALSKYLFIFYLNISLTLALKADSWQNSDSTHSFLIYTFSLFTKEIQIPTKFTFLNRFLRRFKFKPLESIVLFNKLTHLIM